MPMGCLMAALEEARRMKLIHAPNLLVTPTSKRFLLLAVDAKRANGKKKAVELGFPARLGGENRLGLRAEEQTISFRRGRADVLIWCCKALFGVAACCKVL